MIWLVFLGNIVGVAECKQRGIGLAKVLTQQKSWMNAFFESRVFLAPTLRFALTDHGHHPNSYCVATSETQKAVPL